MTPPWSLTAVNVTLGRDDLGPQSAFIELPASLFQLLLEERNTTQIRLFLTFYENAVLFPLGEDGEREVVGSAIIGATVVNQIFDNLEGPVVVYFEVFPNNNEVTADASRLCVDQVQII